MLILFFGYYLYLWARFPMFRRYILPPFSGSKCVGPQKECLHNVLSTLLILALTRHQSLFYLPPFPFQNRMVCIHSNSPTYTLSQSRDREKHGYGSCRAQNKEWLCWRGPGANYQTRPTNFDPADGGNIAHNHMV
jgi:hypothetical protein